MNIITLDEVVDITKNANGANVIPVCKSVFADTDTPVSAWMKLCKGSDYNFLLESADGDGRHARYSFIGKDPYMTFSATGKDWKIDVAQSYKDEYDRIDTYKNFGTSGSGDPMNVLRKLCANYNAARVKDVPRFCGGAVGYFSYDTVRLFENIPDKNKKSDINFDENQPDIFFGFYRDVVAFDNKKNRLLYISNIFIDGTSDIKTQYENALLSIDNMEKNITEKTASAAHSIIPRGEISSNFKKEDFVAAVNKCKEYIKNGDIFQVVLSQKFSAKVDADPFDIYRALRVINPSPYMFYLSLNDFNVVGASPEMLVRVEDGVAQNRPIAGTRRRGETDEDDERLAQELKHDEKEIAEHVMLVDLGRNDLGRVCEYGSVKVDNMMHIEKYSHVMHMVTNLSGRLKRNNDGTNLDAFDALASCFPAGTLSGAPKIRAMEIIDELEPTRRGLYGGASGYIDFSGNMDTCIIIRTMVYKNGIATIQAGAGIVADSNPLREYDETVEKASALVAAIYNT